MKLDHWKARAASSLPYLIILAGLGAVGLALLVDYVGIGDDPGFGPAQAKLAIFGCLIMLSGCLTVPPVRRRVLFRWVMPFAEYRQPAPSAPGRLGQVFLVALWFGLVMGLSDLVYYADVWLVRSDANRLTFNVLHAFWMAPLAGILMTGVAGLVLALMSFWWPRAAGMGSVVAVFGFPVFLSLVLMVFPRLHIAAIVMLALGLAAVAARFIAAHPHRFYGLVRRTAVPMAAVVVVLAAGVLGWDRWSEHQALAGLPPAEADAPNVLFITLDTVRARSLSLYGYDRPTTPSLEQFAEEGVTFDWPISPAPWTLPSHSSMFTGRWPHELSAGFSTPLDDAYSTLAEVLSSRGYETAGFVANTGYGPRVFGLNRGMIHYEDREVTLWEVFRSSSLVYALFSGDRLDRFTGHNTLWSRKDAAHLNEDFLNWMERRSEPGRPFFAFLNYFDAHDPYVPPPRFAKQFAGKSNPVGVQKLYEKVPAWYTAELNDAYDGSIAYLDEQLGLLLTNLRRRGTLDNTLVIITSDHGEHIDEHGMQGHGVSLYLSETHVPLVISFPGRVPSDMRVPQPVSLRDLPATVVDLLHLKGGEVFPGESLARYWQGDFDSSTSSEELVLSEVSGRRWLADWHPAQKGDMKSLVDSYQLYIKNGDGSEELYDIQEDPQEENDLVTDSESQVVLENFRSMLDTLPSSARYRGAKVLPADR